MNFFVLLVILKLLSVSFGRCASSGTHKVLLRV